MQEKWIETTIGEQVTLQRGFDITRIEQSLGKIPVVSSGGISSFHDKAQVTGPGVVLGRKGVVGSVYYIESDYWPHDTTLWVKDFHGNDPRFVYYFFKNFAPRLAKLDVGSANPTLNRNHVHPTETIWPLLPTQHAIARILGSLDDKIELNHQMNETLEAMARAIFQSWFVDFDPVRAKAEGRDTGLPPEIAALFPDGFEEVDGREMPRGWSVKPLSDSFDVRMGQSPPGTTYNENGEGISFFQGRTDFGFRYPTVRIFCTAPTRFAEVGDTLVSVRAPVGDINLTTEKCCIGRGVATVRHKTGSRSFTYYQMLSIKDIFALFESEGTVFGSIAKTDFNSIECITPPDEIVKKFEAVAFPIDQMIENNEQQSRTLAKIRDALLPKLMSGEITAVVKLL
ncbi:MAG: restriction endonuclease subunit S [Methanoregula sp.]|nr:restriction endonuclease subunit S [Methanoregula sp.]